MAYNYRKLNEVLFVESAPDANVLIEEAGEIKRIPVSKVAIPQTKADWNEDDINSPAFILNKPDFVNEGSASVITYTIESSTLMLNGVAVTKEDLFDAWNNGSLLRIGVIDTYNRGESGNIVAVHFDLSSGSITDATITYFTGSSVTPSTLTIY